MCSSGGGGGGYTGGSKAPAVPQGDVGATIPPPDRTIRRPAAQASPYALSSSSVAEQKTLLGS